MWCYFETLAFKSTHATFAVAYNKNEIVRK